MTREAATDVAVPPERVWERLSDFGAIAAWAPPVSHSTLLTSVPLGVGSVRRVQVGRTALREVIVAWEPPFHLAYRISGLPPVLGEVTTAWEVEPAGPGRSRVSVLSGFAPGTPGLIVRLAGRRLAAANRALLDGLTADLGRRAEASA